MSVIRRRWELVIKSMTIDDADESMIFGGSIRTTVLEALEGRRGDVIQRSLSQHYANRRSPRPLKHLSVETRTRHKVGNIERVSRKGHPIFVRLIWRLAISILGLIPRLL